MKLAVLTTEEDAAWVMAFEHYANSRHSDAAADRAAWADVQEQFPRLRNYDGCTPEPEVETP